MEITAKKDIYDEEGRLLLSKGQIITDEIIAKLKRFGLSEPEEIIDLSMLLKSNILFLIRLPKHSRKEKESATSTFWNVLIRY
ncbi:MAG: hypothetical protein WBI26_07840 [Syntrophomonadaceae bacterium]